MWKWHSFSGFGTVAELAILARDVVCLYRRFNVFLLLFVGCEFLMVYRLFGFVFVLSCRPMLVVRYLCYVFFQ